MLRRGAFVQRGLRWGAFALTTLALASVASDGADARSRRHRHHAARHVSYDPPTSSIVVDANSGTVLESSNPDAIRHPASLTKMMTLYLLFERLQSGQLSLSSELPVSAHAAAQAPSKLGLKSGDSIRVETAIKAIVTKSANDVAVVIGEALGGDEPSFARMMTAKARALGMSRTIYRNASGLPDDDQVTTARDQSIIGRALRDRFPQYFHYFSTRSFAFRGDTVRGHNRLLGSIDGVDGIKTGYIHESGFNIVTSVHRGNRNLVAVVFGGRTARARDARVASLIESTMDKAIARRTAPAVVEGWQTARSVPEAEPARTEVVAQAAPAPVQETRETRATVEVGSTAPIKPIAVKTISVHSSSIQKTALSAVPPTSGRLSPGHTSKVTDIATVKAETLPPPAEQPRSAPVQRVASALPQKLAVAEPAASAPAPQAKVHASGWMIQVGAFDDEKEAKHRLSAAQDRAKDQLGSADPFTERVSKGSKSLYRARFAGLDKDAAESACKHLKRSDIPCMLLKN
jgi:D-alanyl-D-alanine carboxypeptidase